jgi:tetratricopeptide (TPR) repeat protein
MAPALLYFIISFVRMTELLGAGSSMKQVFTSPWPSPRQSVCQSPIQVILLAIFFSIFPFSNAWAAETVKVQSFPTHSRVIFSLDPSVETQLKPTSKGFEVLFKGISLSDLGAPLGEEAAWENQFTRTGDSRIASLHFSEVTDGVKVVGTWKFPEGKNALVNPKMETFDFRQSMTQNPSVGRNAYVVDFWLQKGAMTLSQYKAHQKAEAQAEQVRKNEDYKRSRAERRIASEKRKANIEDTTRFCAEPLSEKKDIFLQLYPVHQKVDFKRWFPTNTADEKLKYEEPEAQDKSKEASYVRLALDLYKEGKVALVLKTLDFFSAEHPNSQYRLRMKFLRANAMLKLGMAKDGETLLGDIMNEATDNPVALHSAMYLAYQHMERGEMLAATENFLWLIAHFETYNNAWIFHLGAAETLYSLKRTDRALKEYEWVAEKAPDMDSRAEGALRAADLYMARFQYDQALAGYFQSMHYFPDQAAKFAPLHINRAEALYGLGQWDRAKEAFEAFLREYPGNPSGWRAAFRLGEIEGRKTAEADQISSREWFYETINSYPFSPGATLARMRLLPCGDHAGFDLLASEHFFGTELDHFDPSTEINMVPFQALKTLTEVQSLIAFGKESQAVEIATAELRKPVHMELHEILNVTLGGVFRKSILRMLDEGKKYEALNFYKEKAQILPKGGGTPEETDYLLKLSQAASDLGLGNLAKEIADVYAKANAANSGRAVAQSVTPDLEVLLATSEQHFTEAKAVWVASGMKEEAQVRAHLADVHEESPFSYESELILGLMDQKKGKLTAALSHAIRAQLLKPETAKNADQRVVAWIADLQAQAGDPSVALAMENNLEKHLRLKPVTPMTNDSIAASLGIPAMPPLDVVLLAEGQLLEKQGHWGEAAATYARAVDEKMGGNQALYQYARSLRKTGVPANLTKAHAVLEKLVAATATPANGVAAKEDFWTKLAREALADETMEGGK